MNVPEGLKYSKDHEWVKIEKEQTVRIGITDFAQSELGDVVFVELPEEGDDIDVGESFGSVESVKTVSELYAPVSGKVVAVNTALEDAPELVNSSPYNDAWMVVVKLAEPKQMDDLLSAEAYAEINETD